jgi:putative ATP-binding cassette transporter
MTLVKFILRTCRGLVVATVSMSLLSGACNAGLIALVNIALTRTGSASRGLVWAFVALGLGKVVSLFFSQAVLAGFSQRAVAELRRDLIRSRRTGDPAYSGRANPSSSVRRVISLFCQKWFL